MAFASPPSAITFNNRLSRPSISQCPRRPFHTPSKTTTTTSRPSSIKPYSIPIMSSKQHNESSSISNEASIDKKSWTSHLIRASRIVGLSAAAVVTAAAGSQVLNRLSGRRSDLIPASVMIEKVEAASQYSKKTLSEKLSQVPVFAVTNASGQPYLANMDGSGSQVGLIFFSHLDALNMLKDMQKNPGASDARVYIMGLDKAYEMVKAKPTPSGIRSSSGEELTMVFRFYPDSKQVKAAEGLARKLRLRGNVDGVPVFVAKGLTLRKGGENVVPLFLTKEDLDAAWLKLKETNKDLPNSAQVVVGNLLFIIQQMESGETPELKNMGFFAPKASVEYVAKEQAGPVGQARLHQNPVNAQN